MNESLYNKLVILFDHISSSMVLYRIVLRWLKMKGFEKVPRYPIMTTRTMIDETYMMLDELINEYRPHFESQSITKTKVNESNSNFVNTEEIVTNVDRFLVGDIVFWQYANGQIRAEIIAIDKNIATIKYLAPGRSYKTIEETRNVNIQFLVFVKRK